MKKKLFSAMGLMSGTSMDGVDISIIKSDGHQEISFIFDEYFEYDSDLHKQILNIRDKILNASDLLVYSSELDLLEKKITLFNAKIINQILLKFEHEIDLVGFHGQTILHDPHHKITKQLGDGNLLSQLVKKTVVYDFRQADIVNNGQGAPLAPIFHYLLANKISDKYNLKLPISILNIGGISNVTQIINFSNQVQDNLLAFDIAPGNCLIDEWVRNNSNLYFDKSGEIAKSGQIHQYILNQAIENFEIKNYSNSLDTKDFDISFVRGLSLEDGATTLTDFTASVIAEELSLCLENSIEPIKNILLCGGGRKNKVLINKIKKGLKSDINLNLIDDHGIDGDFVESQAFAFLAVRTILQLPISFPDTTGCEKPCIGGKLIKN